MLKKLIVVLVLALMVPVLFLTETYSAVNFDFTPQWKVGNYWDTVIREMLGAILGRQGERETESPGPSNFINFKVTDLSDIDGETCYVIEIAYKNPTNDSDRKVGLRLYIRQSDFTLKRIAKLTRDSVNSPWKTCDFYNNNSDFIMFDMPFNISIPCDFPNFPVNNVNEERTAKTPAGLIVTQKLTFLTETTLQVELTTNDGTGIIKTTQIWQRGKPWWSSCKREFIYKDYDTGEMKTRIESDPVLLGTDTTPPVLQLSVTPTILWPPNQKMVEIKPTLSVSDNYDRYPDVTLKSVTSSESDKENKDTQITKDGTIFVRATREGKGKGRVYTITYIATDSSGNKSTASATVTVPHDMGK